METPKILASKLADTKTGPNSFTGDDRWPFIRKMEGKTTSSESWTDEKHLRYLRSIEASFVRTMRENNSRFPLRLDRYLPDTTDSTLDLKSHQKTRLKHSINSEYTGPRGRTEGRAEKRSKRVRSSQPLNSSQDDQVVPQLEIRTVCDEDEKDQQNVPLAPANTKN